MKYIKKYLAYNKSVSVIAVDANKILQELRDINNLSNL